MRVRAGRWLGAMLSLSVLLWPAAAHADAKADAKRHFGRAVELLNDGQVREAIIEFQRAYELKRHYLPLYNIGEAYIQLDQPVEAVAYLERCLQEAGNDVSPRKRSEIEREIDRHKVRIATLDVNVTPAGARVSVDDKELGQAPVSDPVKVAIGTHRVTADLDGFRPGSVEVTVAGEERKTINIDLARIPVAQPVVEPPKGQIVIDCPVLEVLVSVDGHAAGQTPALTALVAPVGRRVISFQRAGYTSTQQSLDVRADGSAHASCAMRARSPLPPSLSSRLDVATSEDDAEVRVDGSPFPQTGNVPSGLHRVEVGKAGFHNWTGDIRVAPGQTGKLDVQLVPTDPYRERYESKAGTQRTIAYVLGAGGLVLGATAVGVYKWNAGRYDDWQSERDALDQLWAGRPPYPPEAQQRQDKNDDLIKSIQRSDKVVIGLGIAGGALLTAGVVVFLNGDSPSRYEHVAILPEPGGGALGWSGVW